MSDYCQFLVNGVCTYDISGDLAERDRYKAERDALIEIIDSDLIIYDCPADVRGKINKIKEG
jgi:hypothetical protein